MHVSAHINFTHFSTVFYCDKLKILLKFCETSANKLLSRVVLIAKRKDSVHDRSYCSTGVCDGTGTAERASG